MTKVITTPVVGETFVAATNASGQLIERMKLALGADGTDPVDLTAGQKTMANSIGVVIANDQSTVPTSVVPVTTATVTQKASGSANSTLIASNGSARSRMVYNDANTDLLLKFGATASSSSFTVRILAGGYFEFPMPLYTGIVDGIWTGSPTGNAYVTEVT